MTCKTLFSSQNLRLDQWTRQVISCIDNWLQVLPSNLNQVFAIEISVALTAHCLQLKQDD